MGAAVFQLADLTSCLEWLKPSKIPCIHIFRSSTWTECMWAASEKRLAKPHPRFPMHGTFHGKMKTLKLARHISRSQSGIPLSDDVWMTLCLGMSRREEIWETRGLRALYVPHCSVMWTNCFSRVKLSQNRMYIHFPSFSIFGREHPRNIAKKNQKKNLKFSQKK